MENNIRDVRKRAGLTQSEVAEALGIGVPQVSRWETGSVNIPSEKLVTLARLLKTSVGELLGTPGAIESTEQWRERVNAEGRTYEPNATPIRMEGASFERMTEDLPIYGTALGAAREVEGEAIEQTTLNRAEVLQYAKRPVILNGNSAAYGLYVSGSSMEPRHMDGELLLIDPAGRVRGGEDVVVYLRPLAPDEDNGDAARAVLVKRLVRRSSSYIELEQYHPAKTFKLDMADVVRIDRVIPWQELLT
jgi:transcriptional regulator with XRE-family HTH domain